MKRKYIQPLKYDVKIIHPLFEWKYRIGCNKEIRREKIWYYDETWCNYSDVINHRQWCGYQDCYKTVQDFINAIDKQKEQEEREWELEHPLPNFRRTT